MSYADFIRSKHVRVEDVGIDVDEANLNSHAFPFQRAIVKWALRRGRAAIFADCGLGKSLMSLDWLDQLHRSGVRRSLLLCPLAVAPQIVAESVKFGVGTTTWPSVSFGRSTSRTAEGIVLMIYLASPYSHQSAEVREDRYRRVCEYAAILPVEYVSI